jgi:hypothetical protein
LDITASGMGTAGGRLETSLVSLTASVGTGGAHLVETDALLVSSLSSLGAVNITTTATGSDLSIASLSAAGQTVTLTAQGAVLDADASGSDNLDITAAVLDITASGMGTAGGRLETSLVSLTASVGTGGAHLVETDALLVSSLSSTGAVNITTTATGSDLSIASLSAAGQTVTLTAQGSVLDADASGSDDVDINAAALTVTASGMGTAASRLETSLGSLTATVGTGGAHLVETDALLVSSLTSSGSVNLTTTASGSDLSVARINAVGQTVTLVSQGAVLDGDTGSNAVNINALGLSVTAAGLGNVAHPLSTSVARLGGALGTGGMNLGNQGALLVEDLASSGAVVLTTGGDLSVASFNATGQAVSLNVSGAVLDGNNGFDGVELNAGILTLKATGLGSQGSPLKTNIDSLTADMGDAGQGIYLSDLDKVEVLGVKGQGSLDVESPLGAFEVKQDQVFSSPLVLKSQDIDITANITAPRIELVTPIDDNGVVQPLVVGTKVEGVTPANGVNFDVREVGLVTVQNFVVSATQDGQSIWFQTKPGKKSDVLTFTSPLEVNNLKGITRFSGLITGDGLTVSGPGATTYFDGADLLQNNKVVINDHVRVLSFNENESVKEEDKTVKASLIEVKNDTLVINGGITVEPGQTLTLLADAIEFGPYKDEEVTIFVAKGATLVLGANNIIFSPKVRFDSDGGTVVLRGAPNTDLPRVQDEQSVQPNFVAKDFQPSSEDLARWMDWLAADQDGDAGLLSLTLGDAGAVTRIPSASPWNDVDVGRVILRGSAVHLGSTGEAAWTLNSSAVLRATAGSLDLHVDLKAMSDVSLVSTTDQVRMGAGVKVAANGAVALSAATGIVVGQIDSDKRIDLYSPTGRIVSAAAAAAGTAHVTAPAVSVHGYGQSWATARADHMLTVQAQALQVSAPSGVASRGMTTGGMFYRMMDQGTGYLQLKLVGNAPERVMVSASQVQTELSIISGGSTPTKAWQPAGQMGGLSAWVPTAAVSTQAVSRYLLSQPAPQTSFMATSSDDLLSDLAYGLSPEDNTVVLSLELDAALVRSTGQLLRESDWTSLPQ